MESKRQLITAYIAVIIYEYTSDASDYQPLYQESFVLIKALSQDEATHKALQFAQQQQAVYTNERQETIHFSFKQIVDVNSLLTENIGFASVTEIYARHFRNYNAYVSFEPLSSDGL